MKTLALALSLLFFSCSKEQSDLKNPGNPVPATAGGIVDLGVVGGDIHHMSLSLSGVRIAMAGNGSNAATLSNVSLELFTTSDGVITNGNYTHAGHETIRANTFRSGALYLNGNEPGAYNTRIISGGTLSVARTGSTYYLTLEGTITTGETFTGSFSGVLSYMDTAVNY